MLRLARAMAAALPPPPPLVPLAPHSRSSASARTLKRMRGHPRTWPERPAPLVGAPLYSVAPVVALPSGWAPPAGVTQELPFSVSRTTIGRQLPVYTEYKNGRTRLLTVVRKVGGDDAALARELYRVTGGAGVRVHPGRIEVEGSRARELKVWLMGLGF